MDPIVSFDTAKLAMEKGCRISNEIKAGRSNICVLYIDSGALGTFQDYVPDFDSVEYRDIIAPTQSSLKNWLMKKHKIYIVLQIQEGHKIPTWQWKIYTHESQGEGLIKLKKWSKGSIYLNHEDCLESCLYESLEML